MQFAAFNGCELECEWILGGKKYCILFLFYFAMGRVSLRGLTNADILSIILSLLFVTYLY